MESLRPPGSGPQTLGLFIHGLQKDADWSHLWVRHPISCGQGVQGSCGTNMAAGPPEAVLCGWEEGQEETAKLEGEAGEAG